MTIGIGECGNGEEIEGMSRGLSMERCVSWYMDGEGIEQMDGDRMEANKNVFWGKG